MSKSVKSISAALAFALTVTGSMIMLPQQEALAKSVIEGFKDNFNSYSEQSRIVSFTPISAALSGQGRMQPAEGYNWAERYDTSKGDYGSGYGFYPISDPDDGEGIGYLYNYESSQFYGVSSVSVSNANTKNIVASGRFCIPDVDEISDFSFALTPKSQYDSTNYWPYCPLIKIKNGGAVYRSVKDEEAAWGASDEIIEDITIESNKWYNVAFLVDNSDSRRYKGRMFTDDGAVDISIEGDLAQLTCSWDTKASVIELGLVMGKASGESVANHVFVDDIGIYTTDYGFASPIAATPAKAVVTATDAETLSVNINALYSPFDINAGTIMISDANGNEIAVDSVYANGNTLDVTLTSKLTPDKEYYVALTGKDVFLNAIKCDDTLVYTAPEYDTSAKPIIEGIRDDFNVYEAQSRMASFTPIAAALSGQGRMFPSEGNWAERYDTSEGSFDERYGFYSIEDPDGDGQWGYLYNYDASQFYGVSSALVANANEHCIIASGRFFIPSVDDISDFAFALTPYSHYGSTNYWPYCPLVRIKKGGEIYRSVKSEAAAWGAADELIEGTTVESNTWYNVTFMVENSVSRRYKGRLFADDGSLDISIGGYLPQLTCSWDTKASKIELGLEMGKVSEANSANRVFVDDISLYTTDYSYTNDIASSAREARLTAKDELTINLSTGTPLFVGELNANTIKVTDTAGAEIEVSGVEAIDDGSLDIKLETAMAPGGEYNVEISGKDVFLNEITVDNPAVIFGKTLEITESVFTHDGEAVAEVTNGIIDCSVSITNYTSKDKEGTLILVLHKGQELVGVSIAESSLIGAKNSTTLTNSLNCYIEGEPSEYRLSAYIWDNTGKMKPIADKIELGV